MAFATDDFNRANNTVLGVNWTNRHGGDTSFGISSNQGTIGLNQDTASFWNAATFGADQYAQVALYGLSGTNAGSGLGVSLRVRTDNLGGGPTYLDYYTCCVNTAASNNVTLAKYVAGSWSSIATRTQAWSDGDVLRCEVQGTTFRIYRNGAQLGADITDSSHVTGQPGVGHGASFATGTFDNWEGGDLVVGGAGTTARNLLLVGVG